MAAPAMAAMNSLSLLRGPLSLRALHFIRTSNPAPRGPLFRPPLHFRRVLSSASAISDEEAAARAAAVNADSGAPTMCVPLTPADNIIIMLSPSFLEEAEKRHEEILGRLLYAAKIVAEKEGIIDGFRVVVNSGPSASLLAWLCHSHNGVRVEGVGSCRMMSLKSRIYCCICVALDCAPLLRVAGKIFIYPGIWCYCSC
ncbi:UNVERIFIED_CONTAM: Adenylylsulfatase HINT1 [Sesamum latifolium]|uniref:Adenylylsulfatase HINT1 n=1 Tax=Sesamum latifolium TaxID=2727402 RepID=A0AAW2TSN7_9LAMI